MIEIIGSSIGLKDRLVLHTRTVLVIWRCGFLSFELGEPAHV